MGCSQIGLHLKMSSQFANHSILWNAPNSSNKIVNLCFDGLFGKENNGPPLGRQSQPLADYQFIIWCHHPTIRIRLMTVLFHLLSFRGLCTTIALSELAFKVRYLKGLHSTELAFVLLALLAQFPRVWFLASLKIYLVLQRFINGAA